jgi:trimeric autotransporter adhesin
VRIRTILLAALGCATLSANAAAAPTQAPTREVVTDGDVNRILPSGDRVYLGGSFDNVGPRTGAFASLDTSTAAYDTAIPEVSGGNVLAVVSDGNGGWFLGGSFRRVGGAARNGLAHIASNGTLSSWDPGLLDGANPGFAREIELGAGVLYVCGDFTNIKLTQINL